MEAQPSGAAGDDSSSSPEGEVRDHFVPMRGWRSVADCDLLAAVEPLAVASKAAEEEMLFLYAGSTGGPTPQVRATLCGLP